MPEKAPVTHMLRPGPLRAYSQVLCAAQTNKRDFAAELSERGLKLVDCPGCKKVMSELAILFGRIGLRHILDGSVFNS